MDKLLRSIDEARQPAPVVDVAGLTDVDFTGGRMLLDGLWSRDVVVRHAEILNVN